MFLKILILFTVVPLVELALLIEVGGQIGAANTIAIVILTGLAGAALARSQGFQVIDRIRTEMAAGQLPGDSLIDGVLVLSGALLLLTPGLITDTIGFTILIPFTRAIFKTYLKRYFQTKVQTGEIRANYRVD